MTFKTRIYGWLLKNYKLSQYLDFQPYIEDRSRNDILDIDDDDENDYLFMEKYMNIYQKIKNKIKFGIHK